MDKQKIRNELNDVRRESEEISKLVKRISEEETDVLDLKVAVELINDSVVREFHNDDEPCLILDVEPLSTEELKSIDFFVGCVDNWHIDSRAEDRTNQWIIRH